MFLNLTDVLGAAMNRYTLLGVKHHTGAWRHVCVGKGEAAVSSAPLSLCPSLAGAQQLSQTWISEMAQVFETHRGESEPFCGFLKLLTCSVYCVWLYKLEPLTEREKTPLNAKVCARETWTEIITELELDASSAERTKSSGSFTYGAKITNTRLEKVT